MSVMKGEHFSLRCHFLARELERVEEEDQKNKKKKRWWLLERRNEI
jgi:hypothetical protein